MNIAKKTKELTTKVEEKVEQGLEVIKDTFDNVARHLPFANLARHTNDTYDIEVDLPGVKKEDIDLKIEDDYLTVNAIRKFKQEVKHEDYYLCESNFGLISRSFVLGDNINRDKIDAKYEDGRLYISFEKKQEKKAKNISIK